MGRRLPTAEASVDALFGLESEGLFQDNDIAITQPLAPGDKSWIRMTGDQ